MAQQFTTAEEEMRAFATRIDTVNNSVQGEITRLQGVVDSITAGWKGDAANAYHTLQTQVNTDASKLNDILRSIREAIEITSKNYSQSDDEQRSSMASITAQGGPFG